MLPLTSTGCLGRSVPRIAVWIVTRIPLIGTIIHAALHVLNVPHGSW